MGLIDYGSQSIQVNFNAPANSVSWTKRLVDLIPRGIFKGGLLTKITNVSISLSPLVVEIGDDFYQVRVSTASAVTITVTTGTPYIILRWVYTGATSNYMDVFAVASGSVQTNDIIVGKCVFAGATLTGFDYGDSTWQRSTPNFPHLMLRVEARQTPDMTVVIRGGRTNYGTANLEVEVQISSVFTAPTVNPRIDVVYVDTDGLVKVYTGSEAVTPSVPSYNSKKVLAEISLSVGMTSITETEIKDVRNFI